MRECIFCKEGSNFSYAKTFLGESWPYNNRIVFSDEYIFSVVGYGPQVDPYILIIPYRHINSMAEMDMNERQSFKNCLTFLSKEGRVGPHICIFEHGGESAKGSSSIDHCHIHVIDAKWNLYDTIKWDYYVTLNDLDDLNSFNGKTYLLIGKYSFGEIQIKITTDNINEHQYFRKRLAEIIGNNKWNWKENLYRDSMIKIMQRFNPIEDT